MLSPSLLLVTGLMTSSWTAVFLKVQCLAHFSLFSTLLKWMMYLTDMVDCFTCSTMINRPLPLVEWARSTSFVISWLCYGWSYSLVCFLPPSAQCRKNWTDLVRIACKPLKIIQPRSVDHHCIRDYQAIKLSSWPWI